MKSFRFAAATLSIGVSLAMPTGAAVAGSTTTTSQITPTAPSRLTTTSTTTTTSATPHRGSLPNTGYDLLPETLLGLTLVGAGLGLRLRRTRT